MTCFVAALPKSLTKYHVAVRHRRGVVSAVSLVTSPRIHDLVMHFPFFRCLFASRDSALATREESSFRELRGTHYHPAEFNWHPHILLGGFAGRQRLHYVVPMFLEHIAVSLLTRCYCIYVMYSIVYSWMKARRLSGWHRIGTDIDII